LHFDAKVSSKATRWRLSGCACLARACASLNVLPF
jgi:hypothetical protein